jgi:peptide/nickel transport system ATP-binding protein
MTTAASQPAGIAGQPVLEISGLCVDYGRGDAAVRAVIDADLVLRRGEVVGLAGESGSGKSTLAYGATRILRQPGIVTGGSVIFRPDPQRPENCVDILDASPEDLRRLRWREVALVFQSAMNSLNPVMTVQTQITDTLAAHLPESTRDERADRAAELMGLVGINTDRLRSYPHELSGGMKQRVMIAMALALTPQVIIMDEPTTALDVVTQRQILQKIAELREELGFAVLFITHDLSLLLEIADKIAIMYAGRLVEVGGAQQLFRAPRHPYSAGLLVSFPSLHGARRVMEGIPGSPPDLRNPPAGCAFHPRCRFAFGKCEQEVPPLVPPVAPLQASPAPAGDGRRVACWLHHGGELPAELARPEPGQSAATPEAATGGLR